MYQNWYNTFMECIFWRSNKGDEPVRDFLLGLSKTNKKKVGYDIHLVQVGWPLGMPLVRKLEKDLWEVRTTIKDGWIRTLFTVVKTEKTEKLKRVKKLKKVKWCYFISFTKRRIKHQKLKLK